MYIKLFDCISNGYNHKTGGSNGSPSEELKAKLSKALKGRFAGENNPMYGVHRYGKENPMYGVQRFGKDNPMYGKTQSESARKKMSENHYDASGKNNPRAKPVICTTTGVEFDTIKDASIFYNIKSKSDIFACCKGRLKYSGRLSDGTRLEWKYLEW